MAVGRRGEFGQYFPPPVAMGGPADGQFERGFAAGPAPDRGPAKQPPAQGVQFAFFQLSQSPLQEHTEVVSGDRQMVQGFRAPEVFHAQPFDPKLSAQFLDPVFQVGPAVVAAPYCQCVDARRQVRYQRLKTVALQFQQCLAARLRTVWWDRAATPRATAGETSFVAEIATRRSARHGRSTADR